MSYTYTVEEVREKLQREQSATKEHVINDDYPGEMYHAARMGAFAFALNLLDRVETDGGDE